MTIKAARRALCWAEAGAGESKAHTYDADHVSFVTANRNNLLNIRAIINSCLAAVVCPSVRPSATGKAGGRGRGSLRIGHLDRPQARKRGGPTQSPCVNPILSQKDHIGCHLLRNFMVFTSKPLSRTVGGRSRAFWQHVNLPTGIKSAVWQRRLELRRLLCYHGGGGGCR